MPDMPNKPNKPRPRPRDLNKLAHSIVTDATEDDGDEVVSIVVTQDQRTLGQVTAAAGERGRVGMRYGLSRTSTE